MVFSNHTLARRLRLQQVVILEQVLSSGTISAASRELHLTQPAISKAVQELEDHFGRPLLTRSSRGVSPTDFGLMVQKHAKSLMTELRYLADDINAWNDGVSGKVMVGTLLAASAQLLPQAIIRMREIAPNVVVQVNVGEDSSDPVFCVSDLLIHLAREQMEKKGGKVVEGRGH